MSVSIKDGRLCMPVHAVGPKRSSSCGRSSMRWRQMTARCRQQWWRQWTMHGRTLSAGHRAIRAGTSQSSLACEAVIGDVFFSPNYRCVASTCWILQYVLVHAFHNNLLPPRVPPIESVFYLCTWRLTQNWHVYLCD